MENLTNAIEITSEEAEIQVVKKVKKGAQISSLKELNFPVRIVKEELFSNKEYSKRVVGKIGGKKMLLNQCSDIYHLVRNKDIFPNIEKVLKQNSIEFTVIYKQIDNVRFYAEYRITDKRFGYTIDGTTDTIQPLIKVQHSYNGKTKYKIIFGYFRMVCDNGLTIAIEEMKRFNLVIVGKHTEQIAKSFSKLDEMLKYFVNNAPLVIGAITAKYERLNDSWIADPKVRLIEVLNATKIRVIENKNFDTVDNILARIKIESDSKTLGYNGKVSDWLIYNGINNYLYDSRTIELPEKREETDSKVLEFMLA